MPIGIDVSSLPDIWFCRLNFWDPNFARCSAREETEDTPGGGGGGGLDGPGGEAAEPMSVPAVLEASSGSATAFCPLDLPKLPTGRGRYPRKPKLVTEGGVSYGAPVKTVTQWVQCERVSCKKWRKIPATVDMSSLPEKWFW